MKKLFLLLLTFLSLGFLNTQASDIWSNTSDSIIYCQGGECTLDKGTNAVKNGLENIEKNRTATQYITALVRYILTFTSLVAVIYIIYAGFNLLTGGGSDEANKRAKTTIISVLFGIVLMWLAYSIVTFLLKVITLSS